MDRNIGNSGFKIPTYINDNKVTARFLLIGKTAAADCGKVMQRDGATRIELRMTANSEADMDKLWRGYVAKEKYGERYLILGHDYRYPATIKTDNNPKISVWGFSGNSVRFKIKNKDECQKLQAYYIEYGIFGERSQIFTNHKRKSTVFRF